MVRLCRVGQICPTLRLIDRTFSSMESLRLLPPVSVTARIAKKSDWIDDFYVPKGTLLHIPVRRRDK